MKCSSVLPRRLLESIGAFALLGAAFAYWLRYTFAGLPGTAASYNAFYVVFARDEVMGLGLLAVFSLAAASYFLLISRRTVVGHPVSTPDSPTPLAHRNLLIVLLAVVVFALSALGTEFVCHNYALSADEFMADFQARIFLHGQVTAEVPAKWLPALRVIKPTYVDYLPQTQSWKATYLPVYAAMRAVFQSVYLQSFLNPFLAAVTVLALYGVARRIWPYEQQNALVAVLLLASSAQFLVMAMTSYSMPAHLALNTVWLWLYAQPERRRFYLAPVVGVLALGLHQPIVHALFVIPFLLRLVWQRKGRAVVVFGVLYSLGCVGWALWRGHYLRPASNGIGTFFHLFNVRMIAIQPMNLLLVLGWGCLATPLLALLGGRRILRAPALVQDAALSFTLTFVFYYFFALDQGHGWGYRYVHGSLSCLVLVAVAGWQSLGESVGPQAARRFFTMGVAASFLLVLPLRSYQTESFIRPYARASEMIHSSNAKVVAVNLRDAWYSADLIRNDPFLQSAPIVVATAPGWLSEKEIAALERAGKTRFIAREELGALGLATTPGSPIHFDPFRLGHAP